MFSVIIAVGAAKRLQGIFGGFLRKPHRSVLGMSAYAYQEGVSLVLAQMHKDAVLI